MAIANTAEVGLASGTTVTQANSDDGTAGTALQSAPALDTGGSLVYHTDAAIQGLLGFRLTNPAGGTAVNRFLFSVGAAVATRYVWYTAFKINVLPNATEDVIGIRSSAGQVSNLIIRSDNKLQLQNAAGTGISSPVSTISTNAIVANHWYGLAIARTKGTTTANGRLEYRIWDLEASGQPVIQTIDTTAAIDTGTTDTTVVSCGRAAGRTAATIIDFDDLRGDALASGWPSPTAFNPLGVSVLHERGEVSITDAALPIASIVQIAGPTTAPSVLNNGVTGGVVIYGVTQHETEELTYRVTDNSGSQIVFTINPKETVSFIPLRWNMATSTWGDEVAPPPPPEVIYPAIKGTVVLGGTDINTAANFTLPVGPNAEPSEAGDLVLYFISHDAPGAQPIGVSTGWSTIEEAALPTNAPHKAKIVGRVLDGTTGDNIFNPSGQGTQDWTAIGIAIDQFDHPFTTASDLATELGALATNALSDTASGHTAIDPPPISGLTQNEYLVLAYGVIDQTSSLGGQNFSANPTGFTLVGEAISAESTSASRARLCYADLSGTSFDPGTFTNLANRPWMAFTLVLPSPVAVATNASGIPLPGFVTGWGNPYMANDFDVDVALGGFPGPYNMTVYPSTYKDTSKNVRPASPGWYNSAKTVTVAGSKLVQHLHWDAVDSKYYVHQFGPDASQPRTYGRYEICFRIPTLFADYKIAWLLWPVPSVWDNGEIDYPECATNATNVGFFDHRKGHQSAATGTAGDSTPIDLTQWNVATLEWKPGVVIGYLNGIEFARDTNANVPNTNMRWSVQSETKISATAPLISIEGDVEIDWVACWDYIP
jgi:hypothetical protein